jgi:hypothetical protein
MSKDQARSPKSYENEELLLAMLPELLEQRGFAGVSTVRTGGMKFVDARASDGSKVRFSSTTVRWSHDATMNAELRR